MSLSTICSFWRDEQGQDLIEYSLLVTFLAIAVIAYLGMGHTATAGITAHVNNQLGAASVFATGH